ncbi:MAG: thiamine-phosphate kinase [Bacteroidales bacterium]|jgi:thiamine-monophosphate kinase|nr:thiamine-phosphate kinase [Bacteroidales bacterium]
MLTNKTHIELEHLGKYKLIAHLSEYFQLKNNSSRLGIGDDAAVIAPAKPNVVMASKLIQEHIHFDLAYFPLKHLGYKAITIAVSDIAAMNARPTQIGVLLAVSNRFSLEAVEELMTGMQFCCTRYDIDLVGLDITSSHTGLSIAVNALGEVSPEQLTTRNGAQERDLICASGDFGAAYTGLLILEREKKVFEVNPKQQPDLTGLDYVLERQLKPEPRVDVVHDLVKCGIRPNAMINVSEGLAAAVLQICQASNLGCELYETKIPVDAVTFETLKSLNIVATTVALNGGEDYELLFTVPQADFDKVRQMENVAVIGYTQESAAGCNLITNDHRSIALRAQGFEQNEL